MIMAMTFTLYAKGCIPFESLILLTFKQFSQLEKQNRHLGKGNLCQYNKSLEEISRPRVSNVSQEIPSQRKPKIA